MFYKCGKSQWTKKPSMLHSPLYLRGDHGDQEAREVLPESKPRDLAWLGCGSGSCSSCPVGNSVLGASGDKHFSGREFCGIHLASLWWDFGLFSLVEGLCVHFVEVWACFEQRVEHEACLDVGKQKRWPWMTTAGQPWAPQSFSSSSPEESSFCFKVTQARGFYF